MAANCPNCGYQQVPDGARFCPNCGKSLDKAAGTGSGANISVTQDIRKASDGKITAVEIGELDGNATIESTVNHIEAKIIEGQYVDRQTIIQNILVFGPESLEQIAQKLAAVQGIDRQSIRELGKSDLPENISQQIIEVIAAQQETAAMGVPVTAEAAFRLGMLAASNREYDRALNYFRQSVQVDSNFMDSYEAIAWLQQSRAAAHLSNGDYDAAAACLAEAQEAAIHTDPLDARALSQRGYIAKSLAQLAEAQNIPSQRDIHYAEAARLFEQAAKLNPNDPAVQNGLGNVQYARGDPGKAIAAYQRAIKLLPEYTAAYHDLALAYEAQMSVDLKNAAKWRQKALKAWRKTYELAPNDAGFSADYILAIGKRINWLESAVE
jgi:tetratricopeptide (TPR) repeat protein